MKNARQFGDARQAGEAFLGVEVSWDMGDSTTDMVIPRERFEQLFIEAGADPLMFDPRPTPENSLPRASRIGWSHQLQINPRTISVKQLSRPDKDTPLAFGVFFRISVEGERDRWELGARVRIGATGLAEVRPPADEVDYPDEGAKRWAIAISDYANACPTTAFNTHLSDALIAFGEQLGWVTRRASGGVYFLPGEAGERFVQVLDGLELLTRDNNVKFLGSATPQYADPRTLQTWQRRAQITFETEIATLTEKLRDMSSRDNVREGSFDLRVAECAALINRAEQYASVLQDQLGPLVSQLGALKAQFGDARSKLREAKGRADTAFNEVERLSVSITRAANKPRQARPTPPAKAVRPSKTALDRLFEVS